MKRHFPVLARTALLMLALGTSAASVPGIDPAKSTIVATFRQEGVPVEIGRAHV